jgi:putative transposase
MAKDDALTLSDRQWICQACGASHDRDMNAAINLKNEGMRIVALGHKETENGRGVDVRLPLLEAIGCEASMTTD